MWIILLLSAYWEFLYARIWIAKLRGNTKPRKSSKKEGFEEKLESQESTNDEEHTETRANKNHVNGYSHQLNDQSSQQPLLIAA